jgi:hypothetical protein
MESGLLLISIYNYNVNFPFTQKNEDGYIIRTFSQDVDSEELTWHYDLHERFVTCEHDTDWLIQFDNQIPKQIKKGETIHVPPFEYHRVIKGTGDLTVKIKEII